MGMAWASWVIQLLLLLTWTLLEGCWAAVNCPKTVQGFLGWSLSVKCSYNKNNKMMSKFWCRKGSDSRCAADIVSTLNKQRTVWQDRLTIKDSQIEKKITVTMEALLEGDTGTYLCGVRTSNKSVNVMVIMSPAPTLSPDPAIPPNTTAPPGTPDAFGYFPVLAGLQVLALLAMSGAVLWVSLWGR